MNQTIQKLVIWSTFLLVASPLVFIPGIIFPFVSGRGFFVLSIASIITVLSAVLFLKKEWSLQHISYTTIFFFAYVAWMFSASLIGVHPLGSILPSYERMDSVLMLFALFAIFSVLQFQFFTHTLWRRLLVISIAVGAFVTTLSFAQILVQLPNPYLTILFGNPAIVTSYLVLQPFLILLVLKERVNTTLTYILAAIIFLDIFIILFSGVRGSLIALVVGLTVTAVGYVLKKGMVTTKNVLSLSALALLIAGALFTFILATSPVDLSLQERLSAPLHTFAQEPRALLWGVGVSGIIERPLSGWGYQAFDAVFEKHYNPLLSLQEPWFDSTHNAYLDILVSGGVPGLVLYLAIFLLGIWSFWRTFLSEKKEALQSVLLIGLVTAYLINNIFIFATLTPTLIVFAVLAYGVSRTTMKEHTEISRLPLVTLPVLLLVSGIALATIIGTISSLYVGWLSSHVSDVRIAELHRVKFIKPLFSIPAFDNSGAKISVLQDAVALPIGETLIRDLTLLVEKNQEHVNRPAPGSSRALYAHGVLLLTNGTTESASIFLERARILAPKHKIIRRALAENYTASGRHKEALVEYNTIFELESLFPHTTAFQFYIDQARTDLAVALVLAQKSTQADELLEERYGKGVVIYTPKLLAAYDAVGDAAHVFSFLGAAQAQEPENPQHCFSLAAAHFKFSTPAKSIQILRECTQKFPDKSVEADAIIRDIRSGSIDFNAL